MRTGKAKTNYNKRGASTFNTITIIIVHDDLNHSIYFVLQGQEH